jgi:hypothetical protein
MAHRNLEGRLRFHHQDEQAVTVPIQAQWPGRKQLLCTAIHCAAPMFHPKFLFRSSNQARFYISVRRNAALGTNALLSGRQARRRRFDPGTGSTLR